MSNSMIKKAYKLLGEEYYNTRKHKSGGSYFYNELLEFPTTLKLLGNVKEKKILDLGCGPGIHSKKLSDQGAKVKGIDISKELIEIAKNEAPKVEFKVGDINKLPYKDAEFDIVFASLVMGHLKEWDKALSEIKRVLRRDGFFVFSNYNPVTEKFVKIRWFFRKFRELRGYFEEGIKKTIWKKDKDNFAEMVHYHKTYGTIVRLMIENGFEIRDYEDCKPLDSAKKDFPKEYERALNAPHFCVWKVRRK
jgi:ubiquinone/menaquinone biosynthesis C-methylase UbiE